MGLSVVRHFLWVLSSVAIGFGGSGCNNEQRTVKEKKPNPTTKHKFQSNETPVTPAGQLSLAIKFYTGKGKPKNHTKAAKLFKSHSKITISCFFINIFILLPLTFLIFTNSIEPFILSITVFSILGIVAYYFKAGQSSGS